jgi:aminoglycoside phosphotransferase (APT) family kinase protein
VFKFTRVKAWLRDHTPDDVATCVIHGDFRLDNLVLAPDDITRVIGVLDWEMATLGDPLMDLGNSLAYWIEARTTRSTAWSGASPRTCPACCGARRWWSATAARWACRRAIGPSTRCTGCSGWR